MNRLGRLLAIAAGYRKLGMAYFVDGLLLDWRLSIKATYNPELAFRQVERWIRYYGPELVVLEDPDDTRKGAYTRALLRAVISAADNSNVPQGLVALPHPRTSKYAAAARLAKTFPQLEAWVPKPRRPWQTEPRSTVLFEAVELATMWWEALPDDDL